MSNSPLASVPLTNYHSTADMSSESILEQMNQTEKRFLPDDDGTPVRTNVKRQKSNASSPSSSRSLENTTTTSFRKRKVSSPRFAVMEEEEEVETKEKAPRLCSCADCYREAAGIPIPSKNDPSCSTAIRPAGSKVQQSKQRSTPSKTNASVTQTPGQKKTEDVPDRQKNGKVAETGRDFVTKTKEALSSFAIIDKEKFYADEKAKRSRLCKILELSQETPRSIPLPQQTSLPQFFAQPAPNPVVSSSNHNPTVSASAPLTLAPSPIVSSGLFSVPSATGSTTTTSPTVPSVTSPATTASTTAPPATSSAAFGFTSTPLGGNGQFGATQPSLPPPPGNFSLLSKTILPII